MTQMVFRPRPSIMKPKKGDAPAEIKYMRLNKDRGIKKGMKELHLRPVDKFYLLTVLAEAGANSNLRMKNS